MITAAVAAVGLATAVWLPTRFDEASANETGATVLEQVFADEFDGARGDEVDASKWTTDGRSVRLDGDGNVRISARDVSRRGSRFADAGLQSRQTFAAPAGKVVARVRVADGQSVRSVFRMLGADRPELDVPDLDVMRNSGDRSAVVRGALGEIDGSFEAERSLAEDFHEYGVEWTLDGDIIWTLDDKEFLRANEKVTEPFALALEMTAPTGDRDGDRRFRSTSMVIDFVRVSVQKDAEEPPAEEPPAEEPPAQEEPSPEPSEPPAPAAEPWKLFQVYATGDLVTFDGLTYRVLADHTSLPGWEPPGLVGSGLFELVK